MAVDLKAEEARSRRDGREVQTAAFSRILCRSTNSPYKKRIPQRFINWCMMNFCSTETPGRTLPPFARRGLSLKSAS